MSEVISPNGPEINQALKYQEYIPNEISVSGKEIKGRTGDIAIYFGGTFEEPNSKSTKDLKQSLADYSGNTCYSFSPTADPEEVLKFIREKGLINVVLIGYSQGAMRAIEVAKRLEENGKMTNGLILLEPTSLYKQEDLENKFKSEIKKTIKSFKEDKKIFKNGKWLLAEGVKNGIPKLAGIQPKNVPSLKEQIEVMSSIHPDLDKIKSQIIIIQGGDDSVSNPEETDLTIFSKSDKVHRIITKKLAAHFGPVFRSEQMAKVGLGQLHRL